MWEEDIEEEQSFLAGGLIRPFAMYRSAVDHLVIGEGSCCFWLHVLRVGIKGVLWP